jgi:hypothetical protein
MHPLLYQGWSSSFLCVSRVEWRMFFLEHSRMCYLCFLAYSNGFLSWLVLFLFRLVCNILRGSPGICVFVDAFVCTW